MTPMSILTTNYMDGNKMTIGDGLAMWAMAFAFVGFFYVLYKISKD